MQYAPFSHNGVIDEQVRKLGYLDKMLSPSHPETHQRTHHLPFPLRHCVPFVSELLRLYDAGDVVLAPIVDSRPLLSAVRLSNQPSRNNPGPSPVTSSNVLSAAGSHCRQAVSHCASSPHHPVLGSDFVCFPPSIHRLHTSGQTPDNTFLTSLHFNRLTQ